MSLSRFVQMGASGAAGGGEPVGWLLSIDNTPSASTQLNAGVVGLDGSVVAAGYTTTGSSYDAVLVRVSNLGEMMWSRSLGTANKYDWFSAVSIRGDTKSSIFAAGRAQDAAGARGGYDMLVAKYSWDGDLEGQLIMGNTGVTDTITGISPGRGQQVVVGEVRDGATPNAYIGWVSENTTSLSYDRKIFTSGTDRFAFVAPYNNSPTDVPFIVGGQTFGIAGASSHGWLFNITQSNTIGWSKRLGGTVSGHNTDLLAVAMDSANNVYVVGYENVTTGVNVGLVVKYNSIGSLLWKKTLVAPNGGTLAFKSVAIDSNDNVWALATFGGTDSAKIGSNDTVLAQYDPSGNVLTARQLGHPAKSVFSQSLKIDGDGNLVVVGYWSPVGWAGVVAKFSPDITGTATADSWVYQPIAVTSTDSAVGSAGYSTSISSAVVTVGGTIPEVTFNTSTATSPPAFLGAGSDPLTKPRIDFVGQFSDRNVVSIPSSSIEVGDLLIVSQFTYSNNPVPLPAGWTNLYSAIFGTYQAVRVYYKIATATEAANGFSNSYGNRGNVGLVFRPVNNTAPPALHQSTGLINSTAYAVATRPQDTQGLWVGLVGWVVNYVSHSFSGYAVTAPTAYQGHYAYLPFTNNSGLAGSLDSFAQANAGFEFSWAGTFTIS